jgi:hypothetical protein
MADSIPPATPTEAHYERRDVSPNFILVFGIGVALLIAISIGVVIGMLTLFSAQATESAPTLSPVVDTQQLPPGPRLQAAPERDLQELREANEVILDTYGWVDQEDGRVRIPIDQAMDLLLEEGLPVREEE